MQKPTGAVLQGSVGLKGDNLPDDVATVEFLLNRSMRRAYPERGAGNITLLQVDDKVTAATVDTIKAFQRKWLGFYWPDGRVDPRGPTFRALCKLFHKDGGVILLTPPADPEPCGSCLRLPVSRTGLSAIRHQAGRFPPRP